MACFSTVIILSFYGSRASEGNTDVADGYSAAHYGNNGQIQVPYRQGNAAPRKPLVNLSPLAPLLLPFGMVGLLGSGLWLAYTVAYWHGYIRVKPRRRRDLLPPYRSAKVR